jgi:hypothetical protein
MEWTVAVIGVALTAAYNNFGRIFKRPPPPRDRAREELDDWTKRMRSLGYHRLCVLWCINARNPKSPCYFNPPLDAPVYDAMREYLEHLFTRFSSGREATGDKTVLLIIAAGLMTYGRLDMAEFIISHLPSERFVTDHFAGRCVVLPYVIAGALLPLPEELGRMVSWYEVNWVAGIPQADALQAWFAAHRDGLVWDNTAERFVLPNLPSR